MASNSPQRRLDQLVPNDVPNIHRRQARYWLLTLSTNANPWTPAVWSGGLPAGMQQVRGQKEVGAGGFEHWQLVVSYAKKVGLRRVQSDFGPGYAAPTLSDRARSYVWKEDTRVPETNFELGTLAVRRNSDTDWDDIRRVALSGNLLEIPSDIYVRCYHQLRSIGKDHLRPVAMDRTCYAFWGATATGKSHRAWEEAGADAYPKDPNTKFWDGYDGQTHVVIDEFRGLISISNLLRWLDKYPVIVEIKGSSVPLKSRTIWITSNLEPAKWYPDLDQETLDALLRRLTVTQFHKAL